ncbi:MAG: DUF1360 domain-containing protein [Candidatus Paceibacterota bacterium]
MIRTIDQYIWNIVFLTFFLLVFIGGMNILAEHAYIGYGALTAGDILLLSLAAFRLTRLFVYDAIMKFFREMFYNAEVMNGEVVLTKPIRGPRRTLADLISCPWCVGIWSAAVVVFFYLLTPWMYLPIAFLAIAGIGSFFQVTANMVGWKAEELKRRVERDQLEG